MSRVNVSMAAVAGLGRDVLSYCVRALSSGGGNETHSLSSVSNDAKDIPSFRLNCSEELVESLRVFFLRLGGATGPVVTKLSLVFEWANFVLAITSGSRS